MNWYNVYKVVYKPYAGYGIYYVETERSVNFTFYKHEGTATGVAKRMFNRDMKKVEELLLCLGENTTK